MAWPSRGWLAAVGGLPRSLVVLGWLVVWPGWGGVGGFRVAGRQLSLDISCVCVCARLGAHACLCSCGCSCACVHVCMGIVAIWLEALRSLSLFRQAWLKKSTRLHRATAFRPSCHFQRSASGEAGSLGGAAVRLANLVRLRSSAGASLFLMGAMRHASPQLCSGSVCVS